MTLCAHLYCTEHLPEPRHHNRMYCNPACRNREQYRRNRHEYRRRERERYARNPGPKLAAVAEYHRRHRKTRNAVKRARRAMRKRRMEAGL